MRDVLHICWRQAQYNDHYVQSSNKKQLRNTASTMSQHSSSFRVQLHHGMDTYPVDLISVDSKAWVRDPGWASPVTESAVNKEHS